MGQDSNLVILYFDGLSHDKIGILSHDRWEVRQSPRARATGRRSNHRSSLPDRAGGCCG